MLILNQNRINDCKILNMKINKFKLNNILINILFLLFSLFFIIMIGNLFLNKYDFIKINYFLYFIVLLILVLTYYSLNKYANIILKNKFINAFLLLLYFLFQIWFTKEFMVKPTWDFGNVFEAAARFAIGSSNLNEASYLYMCDNNIPLAVLEGYLFKLFVKIFGLTYDSLIYVGLGFNIICIDLSLYFLYLTIYNINKHVSKPFFFMCLFISPLITYLPIFYTDTISLPAVSISIYLIYKFFYKNIKKFEIVICGIFLGIGGILKPSVLIILIALIIFMFLKEDKNIKKFFKFSFILIIFSFLPIIGNELYKNIYFDQQILSDNRLVLNHYIMVGLGDEHSGAYSEEFFNLTTDIVGEAQKKYYINGQITKRIKELVETKTVLSFYNRKNSFIWTNGSFYAPQSLLYSDSPLLKYIESDDKSDLLYWSICNAQWSLILGLMVVGCIFRKRLSKEMYEFKVLLDISIFGLILFLFIWEASSRYLINFMPIFLIDAYIGINALTSFIKNVKNN